MLKSELFSAEVVIYLEIDGSRFEVAGCTGNICTLRKPVDHPPTHAQLVIIIDGNARRKEVYLDQGMSHESADVAYSAPYHSADEHF